MADTTFGPKGWTPDRLGDLTGKSYVITGADAGAGFQAARILLGKGAEVVMLNRSAEKSSATESALAEQRALYGPTGTCEFVGPVGRGTLSAHASDKHGQAMGSVREGHRFYLADITRSPWRGREDWSRPLAAPDTKDTLMDIVRAASDWARFEMHSGAVFAAFGWAFLMAGLGFRQWGTTDLARAFVIPLLVAGVLLLILGIGLFLPARTRLAAVPADVASDSGAFLAAELGRADKVLHDYRVAVFRVFPAIIALCALAIPFLEAPYWRTSLITAIMMFTVLLVVDSNANARLQSYKAELVIARGPG